MKPSTSKSSVSSVRWLQLLSGLLCFVLVWSTSLQTAQANQAYAIGRPICYVALGDSITAGWGAPLVRGQRLNGYVGLLHRQLLTRGPVELHNLGVPGVTSGQLLFLLEHWPDASRYLARANLITLSIGGNDIIWTEHQSPGDAAKMRDALTKYAENLHSILRQIRRLNPQAHLFLLEVYNPFPLDDPRHKQLSEWIHTVNQAIASAAYLAQAEVVPTAAMFRAHEKEYVNLAHNDIHPNTTGHTRIAEQISHTLLGRFLALPVHPQMQPNLLWNGQRLELPGLLLENETVYASEQQLHLLYGNRLQLMHYRLGGWWLLVNHQGVPLSSPILLYQQQPYFPLRAISETLGRKVYWVPDSRTISIYSSEK